MIGFIECLFYFLMFLGNGFFVVQNGITTFFSNTASGLNHLGLAMALAQLIYFGPGAHRFIDGLFRFKYGINK